MFNLRYTFRLIGVFLLRFKKLIIFGVFAGIILSVFLKYLFPIFFGYSQETIGVTGRFRLDNLPDFILNQVSAGLTKIEPTGMVEPSIASSWETPDKGKTWTFHLKDRLFWQDGKAITSQNINYNFSDVAVEKPNLLTVVFKLKNPFSPFPSVVAKPVFKKGFLGNGDWKIIKITASGNNVVKLVLVNLKNHERKTYKFYPTEERAKLAFKLGEVNKLEDLLTVSPFDQWQNVHVLTSSQYQRYAAIFFNTGKGGALSEKSFRQALNYSIDKDTFMGKDGAKTERALGPISPTSWAYNPQVKPYNFDLTRAKELIKTLPKELTNNLTVNLTTTPLLLSTADKIAKNWETAGVKTNIKVSSFPNSDDYDAFLVIVDLPRDPDQYSLWHSSQEATNIANYKSPRIDKLLEDGRTEMGLEARKKIYLDFQRFLVEDSPAIFLYHPVSFNVSRN